MGDPIIRAECHDDNHTFDVPFDALPWFKRATFKELRALADCGWGGDYPADAVAEYMESRHPGVAEMFHYVHALARTRNAVGFECHVNEQDARKWLALNRPLIARKLK